MAIYTEFNLCSSPYIVEAEGKKCMWQKTKWECERIGQKGKMTRILNLSFSIVLSPQSGIYRPPKKVPQCSVQMVMIVMRDFPAPCDDCRSYTAASSWVTLIIQVFFVSQYTRQQELPLVIVLVRISPQSLGYKCKLRQYRGFCI